MVMVRFHAGRVRLLVCFLVLPVSLASLAPAQEEAEAKKRLEIMQSALGSLDLESSERLPKAALALSKEPLLRYSDPTRGGSKEAGANVLLDAGVWRLGTQGRPTALVTVELYRAPDA